jgi:hypothetical protein
MTQTTLKYIVVLMVYGSKDVLTFDNAEEALNICTPYWNADGDNGSATLYTNDLQLLSSRDEITDIKDFVLENIQEVYHGEWKKEYVEHDKNNYITEKNVWQPNLNELTTIGKYLYQ